MLILRNLTTSHTFNIQLVDTRTIISTETIITELRESIKQLSAENKEKHVALQDASSELKELKEVVESVSTKNYVFVILYCSNYTVFALDSSFKSCSIRLSFTIIFVASFFLHHSSYSLPYPSCSDRPPPRPLSQPPPPPPPSLPNSLVLFFIVFFISRKKGTSKNTCYKWRLKLRCIENILKGSKW